MAPSAVREAIPELSWLAGVNLSGAEFGERSLPGEAGKDYTYPTHAEIAYFRSKGMNVFRLPFRWERVQRAKRAELDAAELARIDDFVGKATATGARVILDPHNYARYFGEVIGGAKVTAEDFADFWARLATRYKGNARVVFGIMNEPHDLPTEQWLAAANAAIGAIRATGATQLILVPGNGWTGGQSWGSDVYGAPNASVMVGVRDPGHNFAFEIHQYLDATYAGTDAKCRGKTAGSDALSGVTSWLRVHGFRAFLAETAGANNPTCRSALEDELAHVKANRDVWLGFAWWAAGPWWGDYVLSLEPEGLPGAACDKPQLEWLRPYL